MFSIHKEKEKWKDLLSRGNIYNLIWLTIVKDDLKVPFSIAATQRCRGGHVSFAWMALLTLDPYLIMLSVSKEASSTIFES